ncbi:MULTISPECIES: winged helix-turn-helix domain-containing protein [unclassified Agrococcus]|uniref:winged helix-turn-helix domain-containing protein n=1 Tax=unclassified Agrococcus TaxID=2615065 RepID=UPI003620ABCA
MARARLSAAEARRVAFAAQGFAAPPPHVGMRQLSGAFARLGLLQLDTVNVFERSHYLPLLARLGAYDRGVLDRLVAHDRRPRVLGRTTELWAHEAAIVPVADVPLLRFRAERFRAKHAAWLAEHATLLHELRAAFAAQGPSTVGEIEHPRNVRGSGGWWDRGDAHHAIHAMFRTGELVVLGRRRFERVYDLAERALPAALQHAVPEQEATIELVRRSAVALGVATVDDLRDYYRLAYLADARAAVDALVESGELLPVSVDGWQAPAYLHATQRIPRSVEATALLSPFDPVVWHRPRALRLFDFHYRISIYTPPAEREHGYYVLPVAVDGDVVGRIDLKSDRRAGVLRVQHAHVEPRFASRAGELAERIAPRLHEAAAWQGLETVAVTGPGTWAGDVVAAIG